MLTLGIPECSTPSKSTILKKEQKDFNDSVNIDVIQIMSIDKESNYDQNVIVEVVDSCSVTST